MWLVTGDWKAPLVLDASRSPVTNTNAHFIVRSILRSGMNQITATTA